MRAPNALRPKVALDLQPFPRALGALFETLERPYESLIFIPWLSRGGAELVAMLVAEAVVKSNENSF